MSLDAEQLDHIARLARLRLEPEATAPLQRSLQDILQLVEQLQGANTEGVEPLANPLDATQPLRADCVTETDQRAAFQAIAPATEAGLYLVPRVIE
jgi:aspartyl-tRNA(Asn)/glutamyl-tRNA(Gln) amidotransferase subunit C